MTETRAPQGLADAAARRAREAAERVRSALRELDREGAPVSFAAVAARARVSRAFLYEHPDFRAEIEALRADPDGAPARLPVRQRGSDASLRARLRAALEDNQRLRQEIARLRDELELAHGHARELELHRKAGAR